MGEKFESCFSCSSIYTALSATESAHIYTCRCELISFLHTQVFQDLQAKEWQVGSHPLCVCENSKNDNPELKTEMCMPLTSITTPNPWTMLTTDNIAQCDQPFFNKYGGVTSYQNLINSQKFHPDLDFSCLPDPFCGDPKSNVFCLNKNPGKPDKCFIGDNDFEEATKDNLELKQQSCFWAESIPNKCGKVHDGVEWLTNLKVR